MRAPTVTYIETDIIIYSLPIQKSRLCGRTTSRQHSVNPRPQCADGTHHAAKPYFTALCAISYAAGIIHFLSSPSIPHSAFLFPRVKQ